LPFSVIEEELFEFVIEGFDQVFGGGIGSLFSELSLELDEIVEEVDAADVTDAISS
jgi:hypothetical protein